MMCCANVKARVFRQDPKCTSGFTLIELMVAMAISLIILAGIVSVFVSNSRAHLAVVSKAELMGDMGLAASIIKSELRQSKNICWLPTSKILVYQPLDSNANVGPGLACTVPTGSMMNGAFKWVAAGSGGCSTSSTPCICWDRPNDGTGCQELLRNILPLTGLDASQDPYAVWSVILTGTYTDSSHNVANTQSVFKVWARN